MPPDLLRKVRPGGGHAAHRALAARHLCSRSRPGRRSRRSISSSSRSRSRRWWLRCRGRSGLLLQNSPWRTRPSPDAPTVPMVNATCSTANFSESGVPLAGHRGRVALAQAAPSRRSRSAKMSTPRLTTTASISRTPTISLMPRRARWFLMSSRLCVEGHAVPQVRCDGERVGVAVERGEGERRVRDVHQRPRVEAVLMVTWETKVLVDWSTT